MFVKMQVATRWRGESLFVGETVEVPEAVAERWKARGIAVGVAALAQDAPRLDKMTVEEMRAKAAELDVSLEGLTKKADIMAKLQDAMGTAVNDILKGE